jgi:uncharacterized repeat protein (TIGR01451 family)
VRLKFLPKDIMKTKNLFKKISSLALNGALITSSLLPFSTLSNAVAATPKLELTDVVDKQQADRGEILSYTITLKNTGDVDLTTTYLKIDTPNLADYVAGSSNYTRSTNNINHDLTDSWINDGVNFGTVPAGTNVVLKYQTKVAANANMDDIIWSNAAAKADQIGQVNANAWTRVILKNPGLCAEKTADKTTVQVNDTVNFTIKVCNKGNITLHNILVGDIIHTPLVYVPNSTTLTVGSQVTNVTDKWLTDSLNIGNLNPGQEAFIKYQVKVSDSLKDGETIQNVAQLKSDETPNILKCAVVLKGKVLGTITNKPPTELPNTGPGEVLLISSALVPVGYLLRKLRRKI